MNTAEQTHPSRDELTAYLAGNLNAVESDNIKQHLDSCEPCCDLVDSLPSDDTIVAALRQEAEKSVSNDVDSADAIAPTITPEADAGTQAVQGQKTEVAGLDADQLELPPELRDQSRYRIVELLGRGGMGDVYRAEHKVMNRPVALKVIKPQLVQNDAAVRRFRREVQAAARLHHGNIVTAFDAEQAGDLHYLVMEFVDGVDLDEVIRERGALPVEEACGYIRQAAEGLQYAHELGMVHRDVKPHNLMVCRSRLPSGACGETDSRREEVNSASSPARQAGPTVKILDFGLANFANETAAEEVEEANPERHAPAAEVLHQLTQMGTMMGTPDYIAPEQAEDAHTADIRSDIYSLGCTFYTLVTGKAPFGEGSVLDKIKAHTQEEAPPLSDTRDDVPAEVEAILNKMMAKDPAERYQTPAEVAEALSAVGWAFEPVQDRAKNGLRKPFRRARRPIVLTAAATLFVALFAAAATIFYIQTNNGVVRVEVSDPSLEVTISGQTISTSDGDKPLTIRAGEQKLIVRQKDSDFELVTDSFQLRRGDRVALKVELLPGEVVVSKDGEQIGAKALPVENQRLTKDEVKQLVAEAAGIPNNQWAAMGLDPGGPKLPMVEGTPLSLLLLTLNPPEAAKSNPDVMRDFWFLGGQIPKVNLIHKAMQPSRNRGYATMIQPEYITNVSLTTERADARGTIGFVAERLYTGQVDFVARYADGKWQIEEFRLPNYKVTLKRDPDGTWKKAADELLAEELQRLEGRWQAIGAWSNGAIMDRRETEAFEVRVKDGNITFYDHGRADPGEVKIQPSTMPKQIDISPPGGGSQSLSKRGIYKLEGDRWTICLPATGKPRPKIFDTQPGSEGGGAHVFVFHRQATLSPPASKNEIRLVYGVGDGSELEIPGELTTGDPEELRAHLNKRLQENPKLVLVLDVAAGVKLSSSRHAESFRMVQQGVSAWGIPVKLAPRLVPSEVALELAQKKAVRTNDLKQIGIALLNYADTYLSLPPSKEFPNAFDENGKPYLSWRVHILPLIEQEELYKQFRLNEPWDSEHNKALLTRIPPQYKTTDDPTRTTMLAVVGEGTAYEGQAGLSLKEIKDGRANTTLVVDAGREQTVPWTKPEDLPFDREDPIRAFGTSDFGDEFLALMADGSVQSIPYDTAPESLRALFTRAAGDKFDLAAKRTTPLPSASSESARLASPKKLTMPVVRALQFLPGDKLFVTVGANGFVDMWDVAARDRVELTEPGAHVSIGQQVKFADISADGEKIIVDGNRKIEDKGTLQIWTGKPLPELLNDQFFRHKFEDLLGITIAPDGTKVAAVGKPGVVAVWDIAADKELHRIQLAGASRVAFSADGDRLALASENRVQIVDANNGRMQQEIELPHHGVVQKLIFGRGPKFLAVLQNEGYATICDADLGNVLRTVRDPEQQGFDVYGGTFLGGDRFLATATEAGDLRIRELESGAVVAVGRCDAGTGGNLVLTHDGRTLAAWGATVWNESNGKFETGDKFAVHLWQLPASVWPEK